MGRDPQGGPDDPHIQKNGGCCRGGKMPERVQNPHEKSNQAHEKDVGKGDPGEKHGQFVLHPRSAETESLNPHDPGRQENPQEGNHHEEQRKKPEYGPGHLEGVFLCFTRQILREYRNKGDGERALCKEASEEVGNSEGDKKSVRDHSRSEEPGYDHIPNQTQNAA